jgi:ribosomal protein L11 methyltransferase
MQWWEVQFDIALEATEAVSALIVDWPEVQGVSMEGAPEAEPSHPEYGEFFDESLFSSNQVRFAFYLPETLLSSDIHHRLGEVFQRVRAAGLEVGSAEASVQLKLMDESTWEHAWKQEYQAIEIGEHLTVIPKWLADTQAQNADRIPIYLEPGMAFGTGTHQTTQLCLQVLENLQLQNQRVLDIGCGTAVLSIAAAKLGASDVTAIDIDPVAVRVAAENVVENGVEEQVKVLEGDLLAGIHEGGYDVAIANILRDIIIALAPQAAAVVRPGGTLVVSGFIESQAVMVQSALEAADFEVRERRMMDDWVVMTGVKRA